MFDFFKKNKDDKNLDVKGLRDEVLRFIKEELQRLDGGEGEGIASLQLFVNPEAGQQHLFETALYTSNPAQFQEEIQRIADNFALNLPGEWKMEVQFVEELPAGAIRGIQQPIGLMIKNAVVPLSAVSSATAYLKVLNGQAEETIYQLDAAMKRINIGREKNVQSSDGGFRVNTIAFHTEAHESNKYISRQHAHLEWDAKAGTFQLYGDEGGVPPANKTKVRSAANETLHKLNSTQIGYPLQDGDQVILGESAVLEFTLILK